MTGESSKRRRSTTSTSTTTRQQIPRSDTYETYLPRNQTVEDASLEMNSDQYTRLKGNTEQIIRYASEITHHKRSTVELLSDGSIVITPHPRPQLPNELISTILDYLPKKRLLKYDLYQCSLVTKQFHAIANPLLWKHLNFTDRSQMYYGHKMHVYFYGIDTERFFAGILDASPQRLSALGHHISSLRLDNRLWTDAQLVRLLPHLPRLKHLHIFPHAYITGASLQHLPFHCQQLISLDMANPLHFTNSSFLALGQSYQHLDNILLDVYHLTRPFFLAIAQQCPQLTHFEWCLHGNQSVEWLACLAPCDRLQNLSLHAMEVDLHERDMIAIRSLNHLIHLAMEYEIPDETPNIIKILLQSNTTSTTPWPQLKNLKLIDCMTMDESTLIGFFKSHPHLENLCLNSLDQLSDPCLATMADALPMLTSVYIEVFKKWSSMQFIQRLIRQCHHLDSFYLGFLGLGWESKIDLNQQAMDKIRKGGQLIETKTNKFYNIIII